MKAERLFALSLALAFVLLPARAEDPPREIPLREKAEPMVFAHYMTCFGLSVEFHKHEIRIAMANGLDGFAMDFGAYGKINRETGEVQADGYINNLDAMFEAARQVSPDFKLLLTPEYSVQPMQVAYTHMVKRFHDHPNVMRLDGRMVLSSYGPSGVSAAPTLDALKAEGYDVVFIPFCGTGRHAMTMSFEKGLRVLEQPWTDGTWRFACDDSPRGIVLHNANARRAALFADKLYMAGVCPHYNSANVRDHQGLRGYGAQWEGVIRDNPEWVEIVTWNDYNEDTNLMHYKWKRLWDKINYNRDGAFLDATSYYAHGFKQGKLPAIPQDKLFFAYRDRSRYLVKGWDAKQGEWIDHTMKMWPFTQIHSDVRDAVYFSTFLTAPAELTVELAGASRRFDMPAGLHHGEVPMQPGVPRFMLTREGTTLVDVVGRRSIIAEETEISSPIGSHRASRIWAGGAAAGKALRIEAEAGDLSAPAEVREEAGRKAVWLPTGQGAALSLDLPELAFSMYNLRFVYSNPGDYDARLTLFAAGMAFEDDLEKHCIPVWLPPTGEGEWATATLMWTLGEANRSLRLEVNRREPPPPGADDAVRKRYKAPDFGWNDRGDVLIDAVELVRVLPVQPAPHSDLAKPDMVPIPGGTFTMGGAGGEPDELPAHKVTLSPFAIGRFEVTNAEFERFWPEHRQWRDSYSWRDGEPVIYVDWRDSARYCNWLSEQHGLKPVYVEEKGKWLSDREADGFRLPTEAEWEYVATGRGENRPYPWGHDAPEPMVHGNFEGEAALAVPRMVRSVEAKGVTAVGVFPAGASRDGVMDMAGNVCEFCDDWYGYYPAEPQTDPLQTTEMHSRVQRGGSWGYYNYSQRSRDRDFNSQKYPGYIYVGLRVALSEAGYQKVYGAR